MPVRVGAALLERLKESFDGARRQAAAFIGDVEDDAVARDFRRKRDRAAARRELERVLKKVRECGAEQLTIAIDVGGCVGGADDDAYIVRSRLRRHANFRLFEKIGEPDALEGSNACIDANARKRTIDEIAKRVQASLEKHSRAAADRDASTLDDVERKDRSVDSIAELMCEHAETLRTFECDRALATICIGGDRSCNGVVEAKV